MKRTDIHENGAKKQKNPAVGAQIYVIATIQSFGLKI